LTAVSSLPRTVAGRKFVDKTADQTVVAAVPDNVMRAVVALL